MAPWVSSGHIEKAMLARGEHLLHGDADQPREPAAAVVGRERHAAPAGVDVGLVGLLEARRAS